MRWTGQIFWLLAFDARAASPSSRLHRQLHRNIGILPVRLADILSAVQQVENLLGTQTWRSMFRAERLAQWEVVSSYSSATAPDSHGISRADPLFQARKEPGRGLAACALSVKII